MFRNMLTAASAGAALVIAAPLFAQAHGGGGPRGGGGPSANTRPMGGMNSQGSLRASPDSALNRNSRTTTETNTDTTTNFSTNSQGAANSQALQHASPTGIAHANENSVLARGSVSSDMLTGLTTGLTVNNSGGTTIGTVSQVITASDGSIRAVVVTEPGGETVRLPASSLTISGGVVTTTSTAGD